MKAHLLPLIFLSAINNVHGTVFPLQFSIPEIKIVSRIPSKDKDFAHIIPGDLKTYIYSNEADYYRDYQRSYFAVTKRKGGWDCMRHYEILANGCIPYFIDLDKTSDDLMPFLPKELIREAMHLEGVSYLGIDHSKFDEKRYFELLGQILQHTKKFLSTRAMAQYVLDTIKYQGSGNILYLSKEVLPDYLRETTLIGLKEIFGARVTDYPKIDYLYTSYAGNIKSLYGKGMSYTRILDDVPVGRNNIEQRIQNKEFDLIIYGSIHRGLLFHDLVTARYEPEKIIYICGEDAHQCTLKDRFQTFFLREMA